MGKGIEVIAMRILCFGDSNTYGYDPRGFFGDLYDDKDRWVDLLAKQTGHEVINAGGNGREIPRRASQHLKLKPILQISSLHRI